MAEDQNRSFQDKFMLRLPDGMRDMIKYSSDQNSRSMNAEIVSRLQESFDKPFTDLSGAGFASLIKQLEAAVETSFELFGEIRDEHRAISPIARREAAELESHIQALCAETGLRRGDLLKYIINDWLISKGRMQLASDPAGES